MSDRKKMKKEFMEKGLVLCLAGALAVGMTACGSAIRKRISHRQE
ncbi:hypothetical protein IMSAGC013_00079 [Lachnospiraceae bacterium]|nr:hypothetical protein IMSAGC013_00079 [Lachnospiraceae bacterium]